MSITCWTRQLGRALFLPHPRLFPAVSTVFPSRSLPLSSSSSSNEPVFETDDNDDYKPLPKLPASAFTPKPPTEILAALVKDERYKRAHEILLGLLASKTHIPPDEIYDAAVAYAVNLSQSTRPKWLETWLALYPDDLPNPLPKTQTALFEHPLTNLHLIYLFGQLVADKGYTQLVKDRVIPLIEEHGDQAMVDDLHRRCLPLKLPVPVDGDALFEDVSGDYEYEELKSTDHITRTPSSIEYLSDLIHAGQYADAKRVLLELQALETLIPPSFHYLRAANYALGLPTDTEDTVVDLTAQERLDDFTMWFSLIPSASEAGGPSHFTSTQRLIFWAPVTNLHLIMRFGLILAEKGYAKVSYTTVIPPVARYASSDVFVHFMEQYEANIEKFWAGKAYGSHNIRSSIRFIRSLAIRFLAEASHFDAAVHLLPDPHPTSRLFRDVYKKLMDHLVASSHPQRREYLEIVRKSYDTAYMGTEEDVQQTEEDFMLRQFSTAESLPAIENLAKTLLYIKSALLKDAALPHPHDLIEFITQYSLTGRTHALELLRRRAFRSSYNAAGLFAFCRMVVHFRNNDHTAVIRTFADNFHLVGVPRELVLRHLRRASPDFALESITASIAHRGKVWPSRSHCALVWQSLVIPQKNRTEVLRLYNLLISFASGNIQTVDTLGTLITSLSSSYVSTEFRSYLGIDPLVHPPTWQSPISAEAFTPFIKRLMKRFDPSQGTKVLSDMVKYGIQPQVYQFTELARFYAYHKQTSKAFMILDRLEARLEAERKRAAAEGEGQKASNGRQQHEDLNPSLEELELDRQTLEAIDQSANSKDLTVPYAQGIDISASIPPPPLDTQSSEAVTNLQASPRPEDTLPPADQAAYSEDSELRNVQDTESISAQIAPFSPDTQSTEPVTDVQASPRPKDTLPAADFVLYVALMRSFLLANNLEAVAEVNRRFRLRFEYIPNENERLDRVYADWRAADQVRMAMQNRSNTIARARGETTQIYTPTSPA
ncbi:hypothetical protein D9758_003078 [Tetrapyrgos nigripes]|uniref:Uncharacterized protein n=1 Tax=Tetrapyrgos nigripes TaxID=182062 RepID=A0A8H5LTM1_9AGAR|nr:hypothetical protein D9758_003078 [Tetrapyrgos nigripes]